MLAHQKLKVYAKGLAVVASLAKHSTPWNKRHAGVDQLCRASESIVLNLAEAARLRHPAQKQQFLDYLDLGVSKEGLDAEQRSAGVDLLGRIALMLRVLSGSRPVEFTSLR